MFRQYAGASPAQYLSQIRFLRAKELLDTTELTVAEIAYRLRFETPSHFSTFFRKREGVPPQRITLIDEREEIAVQTPQPEKKPRERETPGQTPQRSDAQQPAEQPRTVNRRALFPGRTAGSTSTSEGPAAGEGNAGDLSGAPEGSHDGTGQSDSGIAYDLSGRSVVGKLPKPSYPGNESGKVVVDVTVDASGRVTYASYRAQGSTTNSKRLVDAAVEAARKARFSSSESLMQTGTITYVFTLE